MLIQKKIAIKKIESKILYDDNKDIKKKNINKDEKKKEDENNE